MPFEDRMLQRDDGRERKLLIVCVKYSYRAHVNIVSLLNAISSHVSDGSGICHIQAAGTWDDTAIELVQAIGRRTTVITQDTSRGMHHFLAFLMR